MPFAVLLVAAMLGAQGGAPILTLCCRDDNDLLKTLKQSGYKVQRFSDAETAVQRTPDGGGLLILADGYPSQPTEVGEALLAQATAKGLKVYLEYAYLPGEEKVPPRKAVWERVVVASDAFGGELEKLRILSVHAASFLPVSDRPSELVLGRVAGFDRAVFGPAKQSWPLLFEKDGVLVATTKLSQFVTARYAPSEAWGKVWTLILDRLGAQTSGRPLRWEPSVRPSFGEKDKLPKDAERQAQKRALEWFRRAKLLVAPAWKSTYDTADMWADRTGPALLANRESGDGTLGVLEGFSSSIDENGQQPLRWWIRADCTGETAMAFALSPSANDRTVGRNLADFLMLQSVQSQADRAKPSRASYGLIGWNNVCRYWGDLDGYGVYYGDDNARAILGVMAAAGALNTDRWDARMLTALLGNLRTTARNGFRSDRIDMPALETGGWRPYFDREVVNLAPHFEAYLWACFLWAYDKTGYKPFLVRAKKGIAAQMAAPERSWRWGGGTIELARMLLPLAWLVRVEDSVQHRAWLCQTLDRLLMDQDASGAVHERFGTLTEGGFGAPQSNEAYGTGETPIIQENGDPLADLLYSCNFAFLGLHEAVAALDDDTYRRAEDKLAEFLCRIQIRSKTHPEFDGAWFRAFDTRNWDYWASNADAGWGAWCIESGWTVTWIASVMALRERQTSLWDLTAMSQIGKRLAEFVPSMIPDEALQPDER